MSKIKLKILDKIIGIGNKKGGPSTKSRGTLPDCRTLIAGTVEKVAKPTKISHQSYTRAYSWNRPGAKIARKVKQAKVRHQQQPDSQTNDFEIEESWNDIKEERMGEWPILYDSFIN